MILLEIATGFPLSLNIKGKQYNQNGRLYLARGLFGSANNKIPQLIQIQKKIVESLYQTLNKFENYGLSKDLDFMDLLSKMLQVDPK